MIIDIINEITNNEFNNLKLRKAEANQTSKTVKYTFAMPNGFTIEQKQRIKDICKSHNPPSFKIEYIFERDYLDIEILSDLIIYLLKFNFNSLFMRLDKKNIKVSCENEVFAVIFSLDKNTANIFQQNEIISKLNNCINIYTNYKVVVNYEIVETPDKTVNNRKLLEEQQGLFISNIVSRPSRKIAVGNVRELIGKIIDGSPSYIVDLTQPTSSSLICGKITQLKTFDSAKCVVCKMVINDGTDEIEAVFFANESNIGKFKELLPGDEVLLLGKADINTYNNKLQFKAYRISKCTILPQQEQPKLCKDVPEKYMLVEPQPYYTVTQQNVYDKKPIIPEFLAKNSIVVFDFETTGLHVFMDKILEIGACKIINGAITQTFQTLINPQVEISSTSMDIHGITNKMVDKQPLISEVIGDFYKFCFGSVMVAHNSEFDASFLKYYAKPACYFFSNVIYDTIDLAKQVFAMPQYLDAPPSNYTLATLSQHLGITNDQQHRALGDAVTTAKTLLKLFEMSPQLIK